MRYLSPSFSSEFLFQNFGPEKAKGTIIASQFACNVIVARYSYVNGCERVCDEQHNLIARCARGTQTHKEHLHTEHVQTK